MSKTEDASAQKTTTRKTTEHKTAAKIVGVLIIGGYVTYGIPEGALIQPLLDTPDPLATISEHSIQITLAALVMAINSFAVVGIGLLFYPILKQHNESIALAYVGTRIFESVVLIVGVICVLLLVPLSQEYVQASAADTASFQALRTLAVQGNALAYQIAMIGLSIGSLPFCYVLYRTKLVPRGISVLGLIGYPALLIHMVVGIFGFEIGPLLYILYVPGGLFEIGLALWLIVNGFNSSAVRSARERRALTEAQMGTAEN